MEFHEHYGEIGQIYIQLIHHGHLSFFLSLNRCVQNRCVSVSVLYVGSAAFIQKIRWIFFFCLWSYYSEISPAFPWLAHHTANFYFDWFLLSLLTVLNIVCFSSDAEEKERYWWILRFLRPNPIEKSGKTFPFWNAFILDEYLWTNIENAFGNLVEGMSTKADALLPSVWVFDHIRILCRWFKSAHQSNPLSSNLSFDSPNIDSIHRSNHKFGKNVLCHSDTIAHSDPLSFLQEMPIEIYFFYSSFSKYLPESKSIFLLCCFVSNDQFIIEGIQRRSNFFILIMI